MLYLLPGMGATSGMYSGSWLNLDKVVFVDWPDMDLPFTLGEVATALIKKHKIRPEDIVGGSSLGGIISLEIGSQLQSKQVILIGSAISRTEVNAFLRMIAPMAKITPFSLIQLLAASSGVLGKMFSQTDSEFIRQSCKQINQWQGCQIDLSKVHRIHGSKDHIISCPDDCKIIKNGGHLIAMTHAKECVEFIQNVLGTEPVV